MLQNKEQGIKIKDIEGKDPYSLLLAPTPLTIDIGPAGTAMRFLTAYLPLQDQEVILTGTQRMQQRPIGILVDAMRKFGRQDRLSGQ